MSIRLRLGCSGRRRSDGGWRRLCLVENLPWCPVGRLLLCEEIASQRCQRWFPDLAEWKTTKLPARIKTQPPLKLRLFAFPWLSQFRFSSCERAVANAKARRKRAKSR